MPHSCVLCIAGLHEGDECASIEPGWLDLSEKGNHPYFLGCTEYLVHSGCAYMAIESQVDRDVPVSIGLCGICQGSFDLEDEMVRVRWGVLREGGLEETPGVFHENFFHVVCLEPLVGEDCVFYDETP